MADPDGLGLQAVEVILAGQSPPFEGRREDAMWKALWFDSAQELVAAGVDYFGPVGRKHQRSLAGLSKADVADTTNVVWLDLDPPASMATDNESVLVGEVERRLEECHALGLTRSVFLFSGRGCWANWKLDRPVTQAEAELLMRRLFSPETSVSPPCPSSSASIQAMQPIRSPRLQGHRS